MGAPRIATSTAASSAGSSTSGSLAKVGMPAKLPSPSRLTITASPSRVFGPEVGHADAVPALGAVVADRDQLQALGTAFERADDRRRDAHDVPLLELVDLVIELDTAGAADDDVDLFLLAVAVAARRAVVRAVAEVADAD